MAKTPPSGTNPSNRPNVHRTDMVQPAEVKTGRKRETLSSLRGDMENIVKRLHQADDLTQKSVISLQMAFSALERRVSQEGPVNKAALNQRVDQLSEHLTGLIKDTQKFVGEELRAAQENPSEEKLKAAIEAAENRLAAAEIAQAEALSKVNRHIAQLAKAIEARLTEDADAHQASLAKIDQALRSDIEGVKTDADEKLKIIENSSAKAIRSIGEKVVTLSDDLKEKSESQNQMVTEKIAAIAEKTQKDFSDYRSETDDLRKQLERRVESLEENQRNLDSYTDRSLSGLTTRLDNLEYGLTNVAMPTGGPAASDASAFEPANPQSAAYEAPINDDPFAAESYAASVQPAQRTMGPNLSLVPPSSLALPETYMAPPAASFMPTEYKPGEASAQLSAMPQTLMTTSAAPIPMGAIPAQQEPVYQEVAAAPEQYLVQPAQPQVPAQAQVQAALPQQVESQAYAAAAEGVADSYAPDANAQLNPANIEAGDLPYADPAYAEQPSNPEIVRPGSFGARPKKKPSMPKFAGRKKQVALAAVLLATVGYFALRGSPDIPAPVANKSEPSGSLFYNENSGTAPVAPSGMSPADNSINGDSGTFSADLDAGNNQDISSLPEPVSETAINETQIEAATLPAVGTYQDNQGLSPDGKQAAPATLEAAAKSGDPVAQFQLGLARLQEGETDTAIKLIRSAANKGQPAAQYRLAKFYEAGEGLTKDATVARQLTERAARSGNRIAMHDLALYYAEGRGDVDVNIRTAASWFEKAAQRGVVDSQYNLGVLFESGQGMPKNLTEAYVWYGVAAGQGDQFARKQVRLLKEQLSEDDLKTADARVKNFRPASLDEEANGIFRNVAWTIPGQKMAIKKQVAETQTLLGQLGYDAGSADGSMGPKTRSAIKSFQKDKGLTASGKVNAALITELQKAAGA